jgi:hypothetical protein
MFRKSKIVIATAVLLVGLTSVSHAALMTTMTADPNPVVLGTDTFLTISATATVGLCNPSCFNPEVPSVTGTFFFGDGSPFPINFLFANPTVTVTTSHLYTTSNFFDATFFGTIEWTQQNTVLVNRVPVIVTFQEEDDFGNPAAGLLSLSTDVDVVESVPPAATPLPAALPLFATGLGALSLLGWRRKRKNTAAAATP